MKKSLWQIIGIISRYDVELYSKINGKDIFYFYDKKSNKQLILDELDNITQKGSIENVVNYEDTMIKEAIEDTDLNGVMGLDNGHQVYVNETIYWDVSNHFVIIIGRDELKRFAYALEEERYKSYVSLFQGSSIDDFVKKENMSEPIKQMLLLANQDK